MYLQLTTRFSEQNPENGEIIQAMLNEFPFDTFTIENNEVVAYGNFSDFEHIPQSQIKECIETWALTIEFNTIEKQNWNKEWEKNYFDPIWIQDSICIYAPFHILTKEPEIPIVIEPKMSFGTGHHATTQLMCNYILDYKNLIKNSHVLDMGAGTGVLAILAAKCGSASVTAIDIEEWCKENAAENFERNHISNWESYQGKSELITTLGKTYQVILANIQRNVLLQDMANYSKHLQPNGLLFISGFTPADCADLITKAKEQDLEHINTAQLGEWCAIAFKKKLDSGAPVTEKYFAIKK